MVGLLLRYLNTSILKAWGSASRAQRPLTMGIVRWQFPLVRGTTWHNNMTSAWNGSHFRKGSRLPFMWRLLTSMGWNWKCHVVIVIKTELSDLCEQYVKSLGLTPSGFDFLFRTRPRALGQQTPPEPVLIPYSIKMLVKFLTSANQKHRICSCDESGLCNPRPCILGDEVVVGPSLMLRKMDPWNVFRNILQDKTNKNQL